MKYTQIGVLLGFVASGFLASTTAHAQHFGTSWDGGSGTWNTTNTNWDGTNVYFNSNNRTNIAVPVFSGAGGTVTVDESGGALYNGIMVFNSGNWTFNGDALNSVSTDYQAQVIVMNPGSGNVTINNTINIAPNPTNGGSVIYDDSTGTTLNLGNINISSIPQSGTDGTGATYTNVTAPFQYNNGNQIVTVNTQVPLLFATNGSTIVLNGNYTTDPGLVGGMLVGNYGDASMETGTYIFKGNLDNNINGGKQMDFGSGNIIMDTSNMGTGPIVFVGAGANLPQTLLTEGAQTINNGIFNQGASNAIIGGSDASAATYNGFINAGGSGGELDLRAAAGGTVTFNGTIAGDNNATSKDGAGTVILNNSAGNTWTTYIPDAFEMKAGTTLITNTTGDAFGNGAANGNVGPVFVQIDGGATLGGSGATSKAVVAVTAPAVVGVSPAITAIISPGMPGQIGTLTLSNSLTASSGLTLNFKLNNDGIDPSMAPPQAGVNNDELRVGDLTLNGPVTVNITTLDSVATGTPYTLIEGNGDWSGSATPTFAISAPAGYELDSNYGTGGYVFDTGSDTFSVEFVAIPEPSTYGLMGLGLLALIAIGRWMRRGATI